MKATAWIAKKSGIAATTVLMTTLLSSGFCTVGAQEPQPGSTPPGAAGQSGGAGDTTAAGSQQPPLAGGVKKVELTLDDLRTVSLDVKHLITASSHLHDEVTMRQVSIEQEPEVIGMGTVIMIPVGYQQVGPILPANKKRVDLAMSQMSPLIQLFKEDLDEFMSGQKELDLPDEVRQELQPYFKDWIDCVNDASAQLQKLQPLVQGPPYDQPAIASIAADINQDAQKMQLDVKKVYKIVRKEGKKMKRS